MRSAVTLFVILFCFGHVDKAESDTTRPNVILMMADDMGMGDTSAYQDFTGNSDADQIHTPSMERLARMGVRFTDAHTPSSRCSPTRYGLLTGRYPWRNRLKHWVLFGVQGDPMIERDRPTLGTLFQSCGYRTGLVGKWHVGLRYRTSAGAPADGWSDADLTQPMFDTPLDHGFDFCRFTSRSHGTSGPVASSKNVAKHNGPKQASGPGHVHGRRIVGATGNGKQLVDRGPEAYVLSELGGRHLNSAVEFLEGHLSDASSSQQPFFLYYPANSNHGPYTPDSVINGQPVAGAAKSVAGESMNVRSDYIYENDVVLGQLLDFLQRTEDPRSRGGKLIDNTIVIFTSDNGAEQDKNTATGPFRSNKGSVYEGGHRVPFIVSWPAGAIGDGNVSTDGRSDASLIGLQDMYATFAQVLGSPLPDLSAGDKGAEDSVSVLDAWRGERIGNRPMFFNDHKQPEDHAAAAIRLDDPVVDGEVESGQWKLFFDAQLLRFGVAQPVELFNLATDPQEQTNLIDASGHTAVVEHLKQVGLQHRTAGGHRWAKHVASERTTLRWASERLSPKHGEDHTLVDVRDHFSGAESAEATVDTSSLKITVTGVGADGATAAGFDVNRRGLGIVGGRVAQVDQSEAILLRFDNDVLVESVAIVAGNGKCGGFYRVDDAAPLAIYCVDADIDSQDQSGILSDIGLVRQGQTLRLDSAPHYGVETPGQWRIAAITFREIVDGP